MAETWAKRCLEEQARRDATIPREWLLKDLPSDDITNVMSVPYTCGIMTAKELELTELDATELLGRLKSGELKSYDLTLAFCKRAAIAQQLVNCIAYMFVEEALERARQLDEYFERTGKVVGPYHGLPFSIKDQWAIQGKQSTAGYVALIGNISQEDALIVRLIREAGAVFYCKTTQPQSGMHLETRSNVYGRTLNPFNRKLTCGGSSGGEGALVAFRGSPIGLAADIGGSIRSPAANNGLFGAKISSARVPLDGIFSPVLGNDGVPCVVGPVCRSARDNEYFFKAILGAEPWNLTHSVVPLPWKEIALPEKLKIAFLWDDGVVKPHPPITAAMQNLKRKLDRLPQFESVDWQPFEHARGYDIVRRLYFTDGGRGHRKVMESIEEPLLPLTEWVLKDSHTKDLLIPELYDLVNKRETYRAEYMKYWITTQPEVDFIISPVGPSAAPRHETARYWGYTAVFNLLDWPAYVFPTGETVSKEFHPKDESYEPRDNEFDSYNWGNYEPSEFEGAPISFQLIGRKWQDELVVKAVDRLATVLDLKDAGSLKK